MYPELSGANGRARLVVLACEVEGPVVGGVHVVLEPARQGQGQARATCDSCQRPVMLGCADGVPSLPAARPSPSPRPCWSCVVGLAPTVPHPRALRWSRIPVFRLVGQGPLLVETFPSVSHAKKKIPLPDPGIHTSKWSKAPARRRATGDIQTSRRTNNLSAFPNRMQFRDQFCLLVVSLSRDTGVIFVQTQFTVLS